MVEWLCILKDEGNDLFDEFTALDEGDEADEDDRAFVLGGQGDDLLTSSIGQDTIDGGEVMISLMGKTVMTS